MDQLVSCFIFLTMKKLTAKQHFPDAFGTNNVLLKLCGKHFSSCFSRERYKVNKADSPDLGSFT